MHSIYLAARWSRREELLGYTRQLRRRGHVVTSRWVLDVDGLSSEEQGFESAVSDATRDLEDLHAADTLILFTPGGRHGGCYVEYGWGQALSMNLVVVGPRTNVFTYLPPSLQFDTWTDFWRILCSGGVF